MSDPYQKLLDASNWRAIERDRVRSYIEVWLESGRDVTEGIATDDIIDHMDREKRFGFPMPGYRQFAKRWRWGEKRTRNFLERIGAQQGRSRGAVGAQQGRSRGAANDEIDKKTEDRGAAGAQQGRSRGAAGAQADDIYHARDTEEKKEREEKRERASGWTADRLPIYDEFVRWVGKPPSAAMVQVINLLLLPRGSPSGAKVGSEPTKIFNGYTVEEICRGIQRFAMRGHNAPEVLVKHVAGLIEAEDAAKQKPTAKRGSQRQDFGNTSFNPDAYEYLGDSAPDD